MTHTITFTETTPCGDKRPSWTVIGTDRADAQQKAFNLIRHEHISDKSAEIRYKIQSFMAAVEYIQPVSGHGHLDVTHSPDDDMSQNEIVILEAKPINQAYIKKDLTDLRDYHAETASMAKAWAVEETKSLEKIQWELDDYLKKHRLKLVQA